MTDEAAVQPVLAIEHRVVAANRADVREEGWINSDLRGVPMPEHAINFQDLRVDDGGQNQHQTAGPTHLLLQIAPMKAAFPRLVHVWLEAGYKGKDKAQEWFVAAHVEPTPRPAFTVLPSRWVVERTFAWLGQNRRLSKDDERLCETSETLVYAAMSRLMVRRPAAP
jgi:transposase